MAVYSWRRRKTRNFGEVWVPFAEIELRRPGGKSQSFAMQLDSGAVISLLRRSVATLLGVQFDEGKKIELGAVGGNGIIAYQHDLEFRFNGGTSLRAPFAIAEREDVPNLIGRLGVFDVLQVDFDATQRETRITAPWLSKTDRKIWKALLEIETYVLGRWNTNPLLGRADEAVRRLVQRSAQLKEGVAGLITLHRGSETPALIRAMLELSVQLEYLLADPEPRAEDYLEFEHITRYRHAIALVENPEGDIARALASSPQRTVGEARLKREYARVRSRFLVPSSCGRPKVSRNWYKLSFDRLSEKIGRLSEYKLWYKLCSAWAHADPFGTERPKLFDAHTAIYAAMGYHGRVLKVVADQKEIILSNEQYGVLEQFARGLV